MNITIVNKPFTVNLYGFSGTALNGEYGQIGFKLMDAMWKEVRQYGLKHKGINHWVYGQDEWMFAGVELEDAPAQDSKLEYRTIRFEKYAYYKHIGPYQQLKQVYAGIRNELKNMGLKPCSPGMEIYGHWTNDESKLETEILMSFE